MRRKYEFTGEKMIWQGRTLKRIRSLQDFGDVKKGDVGGWIEKFANLSHRGICWVYNQAIVCDNAEVRDNAEVKGQSLLMGSSQAYHDAKVTGFSSLRQTSKAFDKAIVSDSHLYDNVWVFENAIVSCNSSITGGMLIYGNAYINDKHIDGDEHIY